MQGERERHASFASYLGHENKHTVNDQRFKDFRRSEGGTKAGPHALLPKIDLLWCQGSRNLTSRFVDVGFGFLHRVVDPFGTFGRFLANDQFFPGSNVFLN